MRQEAIVAGLRRCDKQPVERIAVMERQLLDDV